MTDASPIVFPGNKTLKEAPKETARILGTAPSAVGLLHLAVVIISF